MSDKNAILMDRKVRLEYTGHELEINILLHADYVIIITDSDKSLQRLEQYTGRARL